MRILFASTSPIGESVLRMLLVKQEVIGILTQPDRPVGRKQQLTAPAIKILSQSLAPQIPVFQPESLRDSSLLASLQALQPDVLVTFSYGKIIPPSLLALPKVAALNVHASLLPRHRGASPIQAALLGGDKESGITIMYMDEGLDTGDLLLTHKLSLSPKETAGSLTERLSLMAPEALQEALLQLEQGRAHRLPQDQKLVTHSHRITRADAMLDWSRPASELERLIRAMNPKPGAHGVVTFPSGKKVALKIFSAQVISEEILSDKIASSSVSFSLSGHFLFLENEKIFLRCGEGALLLEEVQPEGSSRMSLEAFLRGQREILS